MLKQTVEITAELLKTQILWESRLIALDVALESTCEEHGVDVGAVRALTETEAYKPLSRDLTADSQYLEWAQESFRDSIAAHANNGQFADGC